MATFDPAFYQPIPFEAEDSLLFFDAKSLDRQHSMRSHCKRKVVQLKRQQFLFLDSQIICTIVMPTRLADLLEKLLFMPRTAESTEFTSMPEIKK